MRSAGLSWTATPVTEATGGAVSYFGSAFADDRSMAAISTPTDEWFVQDLRGPRVPVDDESVAEFRRPPLSQTAKAGLFAAALLGLGVFLASALFGGRSSEPTLPGAHVSAPTAPADEYEADWEMAVERKDPGFHVEKRELPLDP